MIRRTVRIFERTVRKPSGSLYTETVRRVTWWFLFIPLVSLDSIVHTSL
jgi:hypothetical protein